VLTAVGLLVWNRIPVALVHLFGST
jgi:hypothetical protein